MRIVFLNPPLGGGSLYKDLNLSGVDSISPPIGLLSLAAMARSHGHEPILVDAYAHGLTAQQAAERILQESPDVVGITATTPSIMGAAAVAAELKEAGPDIPLILGGAHVTAVPGETLQRIPQVSVAVIGEGEATLVELLQAYREQAGPEALLRIPGLVIRHNGELVTTARREPIKDLDSLPYPAWDLLPSLLDPYRMSIVGTTSDRSTALLTSRGCPGKCAFCDTSVFGRRFRFFSADYTLGMIDHLVRHYGIEDFLIYDDTFVANKKRLQEICEGLIRRALPVRWSCCARVDLVTPEMLRLMRSAGCWQIEYGIESGSPEILRLMEKNITLDQVRQALTWTKQAGIMTRGNFIFGYIGETRQTLQQSLDFLLQLDLDYFQQTFLTPYPGSRVHAQIQDYGEADMDWNQMSNMAINFVPAGLSAEELRQFSARAFRKFYFRPRVILAHAKRLTNLSTCRRYFQAFRVFLRSILR